MSPITSRGTSAELVRVRPGDHDTAALSRGAQLLIESNASGGQLRLTLPAESRGEQELVVMMVRHRAFGRVRFEVDGIRPGSAVDLFAPSENVDAFAHRLG
ncbi:MAG: hypothetical protein ABI614_22340, partial [Planctomycetota bacterium]